MLLPEKQLAALSAHIREKKVAYDSAVGLIQEELPPPREKGEDDKKYARRSRKHLGKVAHSLTRHGYQTGWESQIIRVCTGKTPDQEYDTWGTGGTVDWKVAGTKHKAGKPNPGMRDRLAPANSTGAFLSPDIEVQVINKAVGVASPIMPYDEALGETRRGDKSWQKFEYITVIVPASTRCTSVGFVRVKNAADLTVEEVQEKIDAFLFNAYVPADSGVKKPWKTVKEELQFMDDMDVAHPYSSAVAKRNYRLLYPNFDDLLKDLDIESRWYKHAVVCFKRLPDRTWRRHTAYGTDMPVKRSPDISGVWTGWLRKKSGGKALVHPDRM